MAFLRQEDGGPSLEYIRLIDEPLEVYLPRDHPLAKQTAIELLEIASERFLNVSGSALGPSGRACATFAIDRYLKKSGVVINQVMK